jgi:deoxyribodipyrimidine photo-lyase
MKRYQTSLFIFRRDLRLIDNTGLNAALLQSHQVIACFIFDPRQIDPHPYQSQPALQFMLQALQDLQRQFAEHGGNLYLINDSPQQVISELHRQHDIEAVFVNGDYTPFSRLRDAQLQQHCQALQLDFHSYGDLLLNQPDQVLKSDGTAYQVFTAFYNRARQIPVPLPQGLSGASFVNVPQAEGLDLLDHFSRPHRNVQLGGRSPALALLDGLSNCQNYAQQRNIPALSATSGLSTYLKFGCCSVREAYYAIVHSQGEDHPLLRQLYWRDFFSHIAWHFPHVFGHAFHRNYDSISWQNNLDDFQAWADGRTGFPIVDAGMRELKQTGLMHNRVRMIVASFLVKDLHISWRWGERYFARHLLDYDPCVNNGNWQWAASTGCDAQPYFRIFNPWLQQQKFDPDCVYIKRWLPELRQMPSKTLHHWYQAARSSVYPPPMLDHSLQSQQCKLLFQHAQSTQ